MSSYVVLHDISQLLNTQLDKETLATCIGMIESGVNPEALAVRINFAPVLTSAEGVLTFVCIARVGRDISYPYSLYCSCNNWRLGCDPGAEA